MRGYLRGVTQFRCFVSSGHFDLAEPGASRFTRSSAQSSRSSFPLASVCTHHVPAPAETLSRSPDEACPLRPTAKAVSTLLPSAAGSRSDTTATIRARSPPSHKEDVPYISTPSILPICTAAVPTPPATA